MPDKVIGVLYNDDEIIYHLIWAITSSFLGLKVKNKRDKD